MSADVEETAPAAPGAAPGAAARWVLAGAAVWALCSAAMVALAAAPWRSGLAAGAATAGLSAALGFATLVPAGRRGTKELLAALMLGMLVRMLLVAAGLVAVLKVWRGEPLAFVAGFFPLFFGLVYFEIRAGLSAARPR